MIYGQLPRMEINSNVETADGSANGVGQIAEVATKIAWSKIGGGMVTRDGNFADKANLYSSEGVYFALYGHKPSNDVFLTFEEPKSDQPKPHDLAGAVNGFALFRDLNPRMDTARAVEGCHPSDYAYAPAVCPPFGAGEFNADNADRYYGVQLVAGVGAERVEEILAMAQDIGGVDLKNRIAVHKSEFPLVIGQDIKFPSNCGIGRDGKPMGPAVNITLEDIQLNLELVSVAREFFRVQRYAKRNGRTTTRVVAKYSEADAGMALTAAIAQGGNKSLFPVNEAAALASSLN